MCYNNKYNNYNRYGESNIMATKKNANSSSKDNNASNAAQPVPQPEATQPVQAPQPEAVQPAVQQPMQGAPVPLVMPPQQSQPYNQYAQPQQPYMQQPQPMMQTPMQPQPQMQPQMAPQPMPGQYAQPQQPMQYVMMQQSLKGVGGWLMFFIIWFGIVALSDIAMFFIAMMNLSLPSNVVSMIFTPILAGGYIASLVLLSMEKRIAKILSWITIGVSAVYSIVNMIVLFAAGGVDSTGERVTVFTLLSFITLSVAVHSLMALYFVLSKRVKETLVK